MPREYFVYILTNKHHSVLYIGVTNNLERRHAQHSDKLIEGFTKKYNLNCIIYFEQTQDIWSALEREKQLKRWSRAKKEELIGRTNPRWLDLAEQF